MKRVTVKEIFTNPEAYADKQITVAGWARTIRASNAFGFIELNDGSYFTNIQVVFEDEFLDNYKDIAKQNELTPVIYLQSTNIMDLDGTIANLESDGIRVVKKLDELY